MTLSTICCHCPSLLAADYHYRLLSIATVGCHRLLLTATFSITICHRSLRLPLSVAIGRHCHRHRLPPFVATGCHLPSPPYITAGRHQPSSPATTVHHCRPSPSIATTRRHWQLPSVNVHHHLPLSTTTGCCCLSPSATTVGQISFLMT